LNNRRTQYLVDLTALELDGEIDAIMNQARTDAYRRVLNGETPAKVRRGMVADAKQYSNPNYTGNFVGIKKKIHRMIGDQEQRMVAKPVENLKGERGQLYLWVRDPNASGCGDCLRHGSMPPRTKQGWLDLGRGLPRWGDTECNIGCKCMLRPVQRGEKVTTVSNRIWRERKGGTQAEEILGVKDIRMQQVLQRQTKFAPKTTSYVDNRGRVVAVAQKNFIEEMNAQQTLLEAPLTEGPKARKKSKSGKAHAKDRTSMEQSKIKHESDVKRSGVNDSKILENGVKGIFKTHEKEYGMPKGRAGKVGVQLRGGIKIGSQYKREVAFSILDEEMGLGLVPTTVMRKHKGKIGSFQRFKEKYMNSDDMMTFLYNNGAEGNWSKYVKPRHAEGWYLLDSIGQNVDRHGGNWMAKPVPVTKKQKVYVKREAKKEFEKAKNKVAMLDSHLQTYERLVAKDNKYIDEGTVKLNKLKQQKKSGDLVVKGEGYTEQRLGKTIDIDIAIDRAKSNLIGFKQNKSRHVEEVKNYKTKKIEAVKNIEKAEQKWKSAPSTKMMDVETFEVRIALIDNGLTLPTGHGYSGNGTPLSSQFKGKKVSPYWMKKLQTMKSNEELIRSRMKQESGLGDHAINVFFTRLDRVLATGNHLAPNYSYGFESDVEYYKFGKKAQHMKGSE
jgi:hypothetical protein